MTPTLISAFLTYTLITALTPGPNNILALSSVTSHGLRRSLRVLAGMSVGFIITMLICAALTFSLVELDSRFTLGIGMDWRGVHPVAGLADCQKQTGDRDAECRTGRLLGKSGAAVRQR